MSYIHDMPINVWELDLSQNLGTQFNIQLRQETHRGELWRETMKTSWEVIDI